MGVFSCALVLICALFGTSHQLLTIPDSCSISIDPSTRDSCGGSGVTRESCLSQGCCFDDSEPATTCDGAPTPGVCYKPPVCDSVAKDKRKDLGWNGISRDQCNCRGGCFDDSDSSAATCFEPSPGPGCEMRTFEKTVIARHNYKEIRGITAEECKIACSTDSEKRCKSAEYMPKISRCWFSEKTYEDAVKQFLIRTANDFIMFAICAPAVTASPPTTVLDKCAYEIYDNEVIAAYNFGRLLSTMTIDECKHECNTATEATCEGFEYNKRTQRCYLSSLTYAEGQFKHLIRSTGDFVTYSCPYTGPALTTAAPPVTVPPTEPPIITNETLPECIEKMVDLIFVLDESSSIIPEDFNKIKAFTIGVMKKLPVSNTQTILGALTFSSSSATRFTLRQGTTAAKSYRMIMPIDQRGGNTYTHTALDSAAELLTKAYGGREGAKKVIIIETDGASKNKSATAEAAARAHAEGIKIIAIGVGDFDADEINTIASDPNSDHVFTVPDFDQLMGLVKSITLSACKDAPPSPEEPEPTIPPKSEVFPPFCKDIPVANRTKNPPLYSIDPDGPDFGAGPFRVECDFSGTPPITIIHTKQETRQCAKECSERQHGCFVQTIQYLGSVFQVKTAVNYADSCSQHIQLDCFNAALDYRTHDPEGPFTYWTNYKGIKMNYWPGGALGGGCACGKSGLCAKNSERCNCDSRDGVWRNDGGVITDQNHLPVKEIAVGDISGATQQGCYTAGPLKCI